MGLANVYVWAQQTYYDDSRRDSHMVLPDNAAKKWKDHRWHHLAHRAAQKMTHKVTKPFHHLRQKWFLNNYCVFYNVV